MKVHLGGNLNHHPVHREIGTMDEFGVWFGRIIGGTVFRPYLVVYGFFSLLNMQFAWFALCINTSKIIDAIGDVGGLLYLDKEVTCSDGMESSGRQKIEVSLMRFVCSDDV